MKASYVLIIIAVLFFIFKNLNTTSYENIYSKKEVDIFLNKINSWKTDK